MFRHETIRLPDQSYCYELNHLAADKLSHGSAFFQKAKARFIPFNANIICFQKEPTNPILDIDVNRLTG